MTPHSRRRDWQPATGEPLVDQRVHFAARVVQDAISQAADAQWKRRAHQFKAALPRRTDFTGGATLQDLTDRCVRLAAIAKACRSRAAGAHRPTDEEEQAILYVLPHAREFTEPVASMIARHWRVIDAVRSLLDEAEAAA